ncbi:MAG: enoyl-CoA hydratase family protein [Rhodospirillales bacterium]
MNEIRGEDIKPKHFNWIVENQIGKVTLNRPDRKNPLTFESYAELRDLFHQLQWVKNVNALIITGEGGNFCSGGDVHDIIGPLTKMDMEGLLDFTRMTGDLVKAMRKCPQPIIAAIDGVCAGAGAILAMAADLRYGTPNSKVGFLFTRVGLAGCDMGACAILPRIIGQGRATELLLTGRMMTSDEALAWGFYNEIASHEQLIDIAMKQAKRISAGPNFAHAMTKKALHQEWNMGIDEAIEAEAQSQAICMQTNDFMRAYKAFVAKEKPEFKGN